mgnify:CR=1 FL=1
MQIITMPLFILIVFLIQMIGAEINDEKSTKSMEIIEELEGIKRNIYTGAIGYFDLRGNLDFNIAIRTIIKIAKISLFVLFIILPTLIN